jgi:hypothetical protein
MLDQADANNQNIAIWTEATNRNGAPADLDGGGAEPDGSWWLTRWRRPMDLGARTTVPSGSLG